MRRASAADAIVAACVAVFGIADVHLIHHGKPPITAALRRPPVLVGLVTLTLHALDVLGPFDPFRAASRLIPRRNHRCP